jgi:hypothetical protein
MLTSSNRLHTLKPAVGVHLQIENAMMSLKEDPEMGEIFNELEAGGPAAMMKYWNNPEVLKKLGDTMGGVFDFQVSIQHR